MGRCAVVRSPRHGTPQGGTRSMRQEWKELAAQLRVDSIRSTTAAGSGHPTSSMSAADLMAVLLAKYLRYDWSQPHAPSNDRLIFSKGHASPLLYALHRAAGVVSEDELMTLRKFGSRLEPAVAAEHFAFLIVGRSIDQALFYGGPQVLAGVDVERDVRAGMRVFLAAYGSHTG